MKAIIFADKQKMLIIEKFTVMRCDIISSYLSAAEKKNPISKTVFICSEALIITGVKEYLQAAVKCGMTIFSVTSELNLLSQAAKQNVREMREML